MRILEERINGENYKSKLQLVADWDSTVTERQRLVDMQTSQKRLTSAKKDEASLLTTSVSLSPLTLQLVRMRLIQRRKLLPQTRSG